MSIEESNMATVRTLIGAIERFDVAAASALYHPDVVQTEYPNRLYAKGQVRTREVMMRDMPKGAQVLRSQRYPIETIFAAGDRVTVETRWEGVLNVPLGSLQVGLLSPLIGTPATITVGAVICATAAAITLWIVRRRDAALSGSSPSAPAEGRVPPPSDPG